MPGSITSENIEDLALGAAILGAGGGGDPYLGKLMVRKALAGGGNIALLAPYELPDDALVIPTAMIGAPTVMMEKIPSGDEAYRALRTLEEHLGRRAFATMPIEAGGLNSTIPLVVAAKAGIPVVDADGMGRAFPELQMGTFHIYGLQGSPMAIHDERGDSCLINCADNYMLEHICRGITVRMGGVAYIAGYPMTGRQVKELAIPSTLSMGVNLGRAIRVRSRDRDPVDSVIEVTGNSIYGRAIALFRGKIVDLERETAGGFIKGKATIRGVEACQGSTLEVQFQNENLIAIIDGQIAASVPDLISFLDAETGHPITIEGLRNGFRVTVLGIPTPEIMRSTAALAVWGPRCFGYDIDFRPLELIHPTYYR